MAKIFLALPSQGTVIPATIAAVNQASVKHIVAARTAETGHIPHCFNCLWCEAYNEQIKEQYTHWAMVHSDLRVEPFYLDVMVDEMERVGADILSVAIPVGDERGLTSIGIHRPGTWDVRRLTLTEIYQLPKTFTWQNRAENLVVNTGILLCRFGQKWNDDFPGFEIRTRLLQGYKKRFPGQFPEDWGFSAWANRQGLKVYATSKVKAWHRKIKEYANDSVWGAWVTDQEYCDYNKEGE